MTGMAAARVMLGGGTGILRTMPGPDQPVPEWVRAALSALPAAMAESDKRAGAVERACTDAVGAAALTGLVGRTVPGAVVDHTRKGQPVVQLFEPAVLSVARGSATPGEQVSVGVVSADIARGTAILQIVADG